jgi:predicted negative regulator of RcsB-dependent stress response
MMDTYQTEEEQVERIKKWWADNSRSLIAGVVLGLIGLFGWQSWQGQQQNHALKASDAYQQLAQSMESSTFEAAIVLAEEIDKTYSDTPYAALAGLQKAKAQLETGDRKAAVESLEKVADLDGNKALQHIARIRAFRIRLADGDANGVVSDLESVISGENGINPGQFIGQYEALKGDAYRQLGNVEKARSGYMAALRDATLDSQLIQLKLDDLGPPTIVDGTETVQEIEK